ncbi:L,D-transpeptidase family protein [Amaricoccus solimangrovi]|uniref:L,D-TPase catalytic domain-containing protein n=1 Tax=Amaricoccus solimangrovi TaxID=2589815 RepID=A0A501WRT4_9RHOB|nr:L,D-transpeptidase family protein [Amaricoccus solimangrovi]TPE52068.1 hypothetical protein FJM51_06475 [Amaricoccus solimangrovi]
MTPHLFVGPWGARFAGRRFPCAVGRGGIGAKRSEGDGVTPAGAHRLEALLYRPDRAIGRAGARALRGGRAIGPRDGWSDDPADPAYNTAVSLPRAACHERLRRADPMYDLVGVLDWNRHPVVPGRGSAIFLHLWRRPRRPTAGCVAFRGADLVWILARWTPRSRVIVTGR